ncbi:MAG: cellulase family glycosylhydrolase, partial [Rhodanobacter sp.]|nr:cellulase family glycosylhydrolase [Rhodanobacter sp.]
MKHRGIYKNRLPLLTRMGVLLFVLALIVSAADPVGVAQAVVTPGAPPQPLVVGNRLTDARTGQAWNPHGASVPSLEYACVQGWIPNGSFSLAGAQAMAAWGMDVVRLPLNEDCWLGVEGAPTSGAGTATQYQARVKQWVSWAHQAGLAVILDLHWSAPPGYLATDQQAMADSYSATFWSQVAAAYAGDSSVMFELFNEPYNWPNPALTWTCWRDGGCSLSVKNQSQNPQSGDAKFTVTGMQALVNAVRGAGAAQPVIVNGLNYANDLSQWISYAPTDSSGQIVAGWHNYEGQGCATACWNSTITAVTAKAPVLMTEFGYEPSDPSYFAQVMDWADQHGIGYLPWAWWWDAGGSYQLLADASFTPTAEEGAAFKAHLAELTPPPLTQYTVTPNVSGGGGTISPSAPVTVNSGAATAFTLTPDSGYKIASVSGCNGSLNGNTYTTGAITANCAVSATFALIPPTQYTVTPSVSGAGGTISPSTPVAVNSGATTAFTLTPD